MCCRGEWIFNEAMASSPLLFIWAWSQRKNSLSLVLPSVGINKGARNPQPPFRAAACWRLKVNPLSVPQVLLTTSKVKWQVLKEVYYTLHSNANPSIKLQLLSRQAFSWCHSSESKALWHVWALQSALHAEALDGLRSEWYSTERQQYTMCLRSVTRH